MTVHGEELGACTEGERITTYVTYTAIADRFGNILKNMSPAMRACGKKVNITVEFNGAVTEEHIEKTRRLLEDTPMEGRPKTWFKDVCAKSVKQRLGG